MITLTIRLPSELHKKLRQLAFDEITSSNKILIEALDKYLEAKKSP